MSGARAQLGTKKSHVKRRPVLVLASAAVMMLAAATPALAASGVGFGSHVKTCAPMSCWDGEMNPGSTTGFAGQANISLGRLRHVACPQPLGFMI